MCKTIVIPVKATFTREGKVCRVTCELVDGHKVACDLASPEAASDFCNRALFWGVVWSDAPATLIWERIHGKPALQP
jgi:hypothetical protein